MDTTLVQDMIINGEEFQFGACRCCGLELSVQFLNTTRGKYIVPLCDSHKPRLRDACKKYPRCDVDAFFDEKKCKRIDDKEVINFTIMSNFVEAEFFKALLVDGFVHVLWDHLISHVVKDTSKYLDIKAYQQRQNAFGVIINVEIADPAFKEEAASSLREVEI